MPEKLSMFEVWRREHPEWPWPFPPMRGAEDDPPDPDPKPDPPEPRATTKPDPPDPKTPKPPDDPDDPDADDETSRLRAENQRLKREAAKREQEKRQAEKAAKQAADDRAAEQGEWKKLAEERADKIRELEATISDRDQRDAERDQRVRVEAAAEKLNYRRPRRAYALLMDELGPEHAADTLADEQLTEAALKRLAKAEPELVDNQRRSGAPVNGSRAGATPEQEMAEFLQGIVGVRGQ